MITEKDSKLLDYLLENTIAGKIRWQPTASEDEFTASFKGRYNVVVTSDRNDYYLRMEDDAERVMLAIRNEEDDRNRIHDIFQAARRVGLNVDAAIDEITRGE